MCLRDIFACIEHGRVFSAVQRHNWKIAMNAHRQSPLQFCTRKKLCVFFSLWNYVNLNVSTEKQHRNKRRTSKIEQKMRIKKIALTKNIVNTLRVCNSSIPLGSVKETAANARYQKSKTDRGICRSEPSYLTTLLRTTFLSLSFCRCSVFFSRASLYSSVRFSCLQNRSDLFIILCRI